MKNIVILGAGTAGTMIANKLAKTVDTATWKITIVDREHEHLYQPGLLFLPFGAYRAHELVRPRALLLPPQVELRLEEITEVDPARRRIGLGNGDVIGYDLLIVATGTRIAPEATEGLLGDAWHRSIFDFYTLEGAEALGKHLADWDGGRLVLNVVDMPIKCPVAPLEFLFLADAFFKERGMRDRVEIVYATPLDAAFTKPKASAALGDLLESKNIQLVTDFALERVDADRRRLVGFDGREVEYDTQVSIPLHHGMQVIQQSALGDEAGFVPTDKHTLQCKRFDNVFVLGDASDLPTSKAGSVAHFQAEVLIDNVQRYIDGRPLKPDFDGHANCFIETGHGKAILIDFNYETEPLPGKFPMPGIGPFSLLEESHMNHWGKLGFKWVYWNLLVKGEELPIDHRMAMAGKWS